MRVELKPELKTLYPRAMFGSLTVKNLPNRKRHEALEGRKRLLENEIREAYPDVDEDSTIQSYNTYFGRWGRTYPIEFQIETVKKGGGLPQVSVLVDSMFLAELKNRILTSGHDLDKIEGGLLFDVSDEGERYLKLNGKEQMLKGNDVVLRDEKGVLASILYGPARRTSIAHDTRNALYFAWCPYGMEEETIMTHLGDIFSNLCVVFEMVDSETQIHR
jgi:DNA/RNA-binding domain of Phe-tRNA-synthetase-like protein